MSHEDIPRVDDESDESVLARNLLELEEISRQSPEIDPELEHGIDLEAIDEELPVGEIIELLRERLGKLGLKDPESINEINVLGLGEAYLDLNEYDAEDLFFFLLSDSLGPKLPITFNDIIEAVTIREIDIEEYQARQTRTFAKDLIQIGFDEEEISKWSKTGTDRQKRAIRRMGWLMREPYMNDLRTWLSSQAESEGRGVGFESAIHLLIRREFQAKTNEYNNLIHSTLTTRQHREAQLYGERLKRGFAVDDMVFAQDIKDGVYRPVS